jgi:hypothetical protein
MRNRHGGYWIAGDDPRAANHDLTGQYSLAGTVAGAHRVALLSDGIERAITHLSPCPATLDLQPSTPKVVCPARPPRRGDPVGECGQGAPGMEGGGDGAIRCFPQEQERG